MVLYGPLSLYRKKHDMLCDAATYNIFWNESSFFFSLSEVEFLSSFSPSFSCCCRNTARCVLLAAKFVCKVFGHIEEPPMVLN